MLYWHFRNLQCILSSFFKARLSDPSIFIRRRFFANLFDSDWGQSVQAGRYFTYTDSVRWEMAIRTGLFWKLLRNRFVVIVGSQKILNRRPLKIFRTFEIEFRFAGWDDKWLYAEHRFIQNEELKCLVISKLGIRAKGKQTLISKFLAELGFVSHLAPPDWISKCFAHDSEDLKLAQR